MSQVIKHGSLEGGANISKTERHDSVSKSTPWSGESFLVLILEAYLDLIIDG